MRFEGYRLKIKDVMYAVWCVFLNARLDRAFTFYVCSERESAVWSPYHASLLANESHADNFN